MTDKQERQHQEDLQRLRGFRLLDDDFMTKCFEGETACMELVLRIVLEKPDLQVTDVRTRVFVCPLPILKDRKVFGIMERKGEK